MKSMDAHNRAQRKNCKCSYWRFVKREEQIKNEVRESFFSRFDCTQIIGNIDFSVARRREAERGQSLLFEADNFNRISKAESIVKFLSVLHSSPLQAIMIGDTEGDKRAAEEVGIDFIGVNYGYGFRDVPGYANSPAEILNCIERTNN